MGEMNLENQLQVAFATIAELREQIDSLTRVNWSLEERLRHDAESREEMRSFCKSPKSRTENPSRVNTFATLTKKSSNGNVKRVLRSCNVGVQVFSWQAQPEEVLPG